MSGPIKICLSLLVCSADLTSAATLSVSPGSTGQDFKYASGGLIGANSPHTIRVGYFSNYSQTGTNDAPVVPQAFRDLLSEPSIGIKATISAFFVSIGEGRTNFGPITDWSITALSGSLAGKSSVNKTLNDAGLVFSSDPANSISANGVPRGSRIFILAYDTENFNDAAQIGIYSGLSATSGQWYIPTTNVTTATLNLSFIDSSAEVFRGSIGSLVLAPVPEPSSLTLVAAVLAFGLHRRRNNLRSF